MNKCLACYQELEDSKSEYHTKCSQRIFNSKTPPQLDYTLNEINELARKLVQSRVAIPGVQPKLSLTHERGNGLEKRLTIIGLWEGLYVLKPPHDEHPQLPQNEDVTMHMAKAAGIKTAEHSLIRLSSGELAYLSTRFDRKLKRKKVIKTHQEDMCQLTGLLTENKYNSSLEKVAAAVNQYTTNKGLELLKLFKITAFSFLTGNSDMHLKNHSLVYTAEGTVELSPAYDLLATKLVAPQDREEVALTMRGKKNRLTKQDFFEFGEYCKISTKVCENVFKEIEENLDAFKKLIAISFLSDEMAQKYLELINERAQRLGLLVPKGFQQLNRE